MAIVGVGPLTASAALATIVDARQFKIGRQMAAWIGLVPQQASSGVKAGLDTSPRRAMTICAPGLPHGLSYGPWPVREDEQEGDPKAQLRARVSRTNGRVQPAKARHPDCHRRGRSYPPCDCRNVAR